MIRFNVFLWLLILSSCSECSQYAVGLGGGDTRVSRSITAYLEKGTYLLLVALLLLHLKEERFLEIVLHLPDGISYDFFPYIALFIEQIGLYHLLIHALAITFYQ